MSLHCSRIGIQEIPESRHNLWDSLIQNSDQGTVFHKFDWLKLMEKYTNTKLILLITTNGDKIFAGIPFFIQERFASLIKITLSPPYPTLVPYLGPFFIGYNFWKENKRIYLLRCFQKKLDHYLYSNIKPHSISIITPPNMLDMRPFLRAGYKVTPKYTYIADVSDLKAVWKGFKKKLRNSIVRAEKIGLEVEEDDLAGYNLVMRLLSRRLKEKGQRLDVSREYLLEVYRKFYPRNLRVLVCRYKQEEIGGLVFTVYKDKVSMWLSAAAKFLKGVSPNDFLYWETIKWANRNGFRYCEIIIADSQVEYKSKYNFHLTLYYSGKKMRRGYELLANTYNVIRKCHDLSSFNIQLQRGNNDRYNKFKASR
jgi:lipid II:glycine glycyltransferase (peptidoglycan interpeptide bridge formation enzyme)